MALTLNRRVRDARGAQPADPAEAAPQLLAAADTARDNRNWTEAVRFYRQYLALRAEDAPIWVQLGHALKESGNLGDAEAAYKQSLSLAPEVADTHLQLGHLYKRMRNFSDAIAAYRESARLDNTLIDARAELAEFGVDREQLPPAQRSTPPRDPMTFIDLSDMFYYPDDRWGVYDTRQYQLGLATAIMAMEPEQRRGIAFLSEAYESPGYIILRDEVVSELAEELQRDAAEPDRLAGVVRSTTSAARGYDPAAGDVLLVVGEFWLSPTITERIIDLGRKGVRIGLLIYTVTPISHPEFCSKTLAESVRSALSSILRVADFVLCLSETSARTVAQFAAENDTGPLTIRVVKPADRIGTETSPNTDLSLTVARPISNEYVIYVSELAAGSNHQYLFRIWKRLHERLGDAMPQLVLVGQPGWQGSDLVNQLDVTNNLDGKVVLLRDIAAAELAALYGSARFTVFPSLEDGWAAPVSTSLLYGRPCVAARSGAIAEIAGDLVDYVDPFNDNDGYEKIARLVEDREYLDQRARNIRENFTPREWLDVATDMLSILQLLRDDWGFERKNVTPPLAVPGRVYRLGHQGDVAEFIRSGDSAFVNFACDASWDAVESFGRWMRGRTARITFATEQPQPQPVVVMIEAFTVAWLEAMQLRIAVNGASYPAVELDAGARRFLLLHATSEDGRVALEFEAVGEIAAGLDPRDYLWFGVGSIGYAPGPDALARVMLLEEVLTGMSGLVTIRPTRISHRRDPRSFPRHSQTMHPPNEILEN
ncbi:MAG TPA: glycosyltransferase [Stellaceae bacterium]|nr:glycosyltransferase [Stellaceae bacterium]